MKHSVTIASRELRSLFLSPIAYVVLTLWAVIAGVIFLMSLYSFQSSITQLQQYQMLERLQMLNLNDDLIEPFVGSMWFFLLFLLPAITMGLVSNEKSNGTEELLLTSPISIWDIVLGKFLAGVGFVCVMTAIVGFFPMILFFYGEPEVARILTGLLSLVLVSISYVSVGIFASSVTRNQLIAFLLTLVLLLIVFMMLPFIVDIAMSGSQLGPDSPLIKGVRWIATGSHIDRMLEGLIDTADLAYFAIMSAIFLVLSKTVIESARWR